MSTAFTVGQFYDSTGFVVVYPSYFMFVHPYSRYGRVYTTGEEIASFVEDFDITFFVRAMLLDRYLSGSFK